LSSQGFEVKDMGERKLKGLENPEYIYLMYPHSLSGRIDYQPKLGKDVQEDLERAERGADEKKTVPPKLDEPMSTKFVAELGMTAEDMWKLWAVSLRLEMVCEKLRIPGGALGPPQYAMMEKMKDKGGEVTDWFLLGFLRHLTSRVEVCIPSPVSPIKAI
jgi:adenylate cyclase